MTVNELRRQLEALGPDRADYLVVFEVDSYYTSFDALALVPADDPYPGACLVVLSVYSLVPPIPPDTSSSSAAGHVEQIGGPPDWNMLRDLPDTSGWSPGTGIG